MAASLKAVDNFLHSSALPFAPMGLRGLHEPLPAVTEYLLASPCASAAVKRLWMLWKCHDVRQLSQPSLCLGFSVISSLPSLNLGRG